MVTNKHQDNDTEPTKNSSDAIDDIAKKKAEIAGKGRFKGLLLFESKAEKSPKILKKIASSPHLNSVEKALRNTSKGHGKGLSIDYDVLIGCIKKAHKYSQDTKTYKTAEECLNDFVYIRNKTNAIINYIEKRIESSNKKKELSNWQNSLRDIRGDINIAIHRQNQTRLFNIIKTQSKDIQRNKAFCLMLYAEFRIHYPGMFSDLIASIANTIFCDEVNNDDGGVSKEQVKSWIKHNKQSINEFIKRQGYSPADVAIFPNADFY